MGTNIELCAHMLKFIIPLILIAAVSLEATAYKIGFVAGTFDPPHRGHEAMIRNAIRLLALTEVVVIPNYEPSKKPNALEFSVRRTLSQAAFSYIPGVQVANESLAKSFSEKGLVESLNAAARRNPNVEIVQILGSDVFENLKTKKIYFEKNITFAVQARDAGAPPAPLIFNGRRVYNLPAEPLALSSTKIRALLAKGELPGPELMNPDELELIRKMSLYQSKRKKCSSLHVNFKEAG
ncbi:MAG: adenylyltransferase/cytidyltransferase family protein [Pseudobdellovibrionaceae bacterium]